MRSRCVGKGHNRIQVKLVETQGKVGLHFRVRFNRKRARTTGITKPHGQIIYRNGLGIGGQFTRKVKFLGGNIGNVGIVPGNPQGGLAQILELAINFAVKVRRGPGKVHLAAHINAAINLVNAQTDRDGKGLRLADFTDIELKGQRNAAIEHIAFTRGRAIQAVGFHAQGQAFNAFFAARRTVNDGCIFNRQAINPDRTCQRTSAVIICRCL